MWNIPAIASDSKVFVGGFAEKGLVKLSRTNVSRTVQIAASYPPEKVWYLRKLLGARSSAWELKSRNQCVPFSFSKRSCDFNLSVGTTAANSKEGSV